MDVSILDLVFLGAGAALLVVVAGSYRGAAGIVALMLAVTVVVRVFLV